MVMQILSGLWPHGALSVVLTRQGAQRDGIATAAAGTAGQGRAVVPYSALLYQPDGRSVIYTVTGPLTYTLATVSVAGIQGSQVFLTGLKPGTTVVTAGGRGTARRPGRRRGPDVSTTTAGRRCAG
jgi:hypothetical protein